MVIKMNNLVQSINCSELYELYKQNKGTCRIIDVRTPLEYAQGHIPGSINVVNHTLLRVPLLYLNKNYTYYLICKTGDRSYRACMQLVCQNFYVINVQGGIEAWTGPIVRDRCLS